MKRYLWVVGLFFIIGCTASEPVQNIIRDKEFASYSETLDQLESDYLQKKISYADYLEKKKNVENNYQQQIDSRRELIRNQNDPRSVIEMAP